MHNRLIPIAAAVALLVGLWASAAHNSSQSVAAQQAPQMTDSVHSPMFQTADACIACHNGIVTPSGEDISFGIDWGASMMANSARDPYWQAAVRREVTDHPHAGAAIQNECSKCHMPMSSYQERAAGRQAEIFAHLPINNADGPDEKLAADGVSCTTCHQITSEGLGTEESFVGNFAINPASQGQGSVFGPYDVDTGRVTIMHSASGFKPEKATHLQKSEVCATCHTLYTHALGPEGKVIGELPEQVPYLEWQHSAYENERSCQSCHMPVVEDSVAIAATMGQPRAEVSRHVFRGGNFFMLRMLNRYRDDLGVKARSHELDASVHRTVEHLQSSTARVTVENVRIEGDRLLAAVAVENLAGHKLPTAYPSRRVWIHYTVRDQKGRTIFQSGAFNSSGRIAANDNDEDGSQYEPHHERITREEQVQVYEAIMAGPDGEVTTGLLTAVEFVKDNRILPRGFKKAAAGEDIAVQGRADSDGDFQGGGDRTTYAVDVGDADGPFHIQVELWYQPIAYRWAQNLQSYDTPETNRFSGYYSEMSDLSGVILATETVTVNP